MKAAEFFHLVEIRTKTASLLPYLVGTLYALTQYERFDRLNALLMLVSLVCIDLSATILNHLSEVRTPYSVFRLDHMKYSKSGVKFLLAALLAAAVVCGGWLAWRTGPIVWFWGVVSFAAAILYSAGPLPIQRTPLGEAVSAFFMGFVIVFLACHIHLGGEPFRAYVFGTRFTLELDLERLGEILLVSLPLVTAIGNVMLANNISDLAKDLSERRYTLPVLIGRSDALVLFNLSYLAGALAILTAVLVRALPAQALFIAPVYGLVFRRARRFSAAPDKTTTFPLAVHNLNLIGAGLILVLISRLVF
ncbi:UbiA family prenyltransferase [Proteiniclasticum sp. QWL-01]|uniref:UbiA family prenyltransferase n=1 Tax=Proteiniclasticum sp. QWL-01 TaxID=3036945 RepID=UPI00240FE133|nr:UbiA family prenyltransferase [Proteiniclasticum sp. QWL-01]WFF72727.1 UbiA family prenyltransferase [Proteiniclasticum sp. QWL-01]